MAQISDVQLAVKKLGEDVSSEIKDASDKIAALIANQKDPADAAALQGVVDNLNAIDSAVTGFDTSLNPPA